MLRRWLEVLAKRENVSFVTGDIAQALLDLGGRLAEAEHNAGFCDEAAALGVAQHAAATIIARLHANRFLQTLNGFNVVVKNIRSGIEHEIDLIKVSLEVWHEHLNRAVRIFMLGRANGGGPDAGAAVGEVVAGDGGNHAMFESHFRDGISHAGRFPEVEFGGPAGLNRAEIAGTGADITQNHDRSGAARPAFPDVGALSALAYRMQLIFLHETPRRLIGGAGRQFGAEPVRFTKGGHA